MTYMPQGSVAQLSSHTASLPGIHFDRELRATSHLSLVISHSKLLPPLSWEEEQTNSLIQEQIQGGL